MSEEKEYEIEGQKHAGEGSTPFGFFEELFKSISQMCTRDSGEKRDLAKGVACEARPRMASTNLGDADGHREFAPTTGRLKGIKLVLPSESVSTPSAYLSTCTSAMWRRILAIPVLAHKHFVTPPQPLHHWKGTHLWWPRFLFCTQLECRGFCIVWPTYSARLLMPLGVTGTTI